MSCPREMPPLDDGDDWIDGTRTTRTSASGVSDDAWDLGDECAREELAERERNYLARGW